MSDNYKDSIFGKIPLTWNSVKLGDILSKSPEYGANASAKEFDSNSFRYIRITDILENGKLTDNNIVGISKTEGEQYKLIQDDILLARTGNTVGKSYLYDVKDRDCSFAGYLIRFKINNTISTPKYIFQYLHSEFFWNWVKSIVRTGAQPNINSKEYQSLPIPLPPLPEQQKIAEILSTVDAKIEVIDQQITETQAIKKGLMQRLLTKGIGHTEFKDSPLGEIPKSWELVKLSEIAEINKKSLPNTTSVDFEFYYIDLSAVKSGTIEFPKEKTKFIDAPSRARRILRNEDVIMATVRPNLLGIAYADFDASEFICSTGFALISHYENSCGQFIYQNLYSENVQSQINKLIVGSNYPAINSSDVQNLQIPFPQLDEQNKIASILSSVDEKLEVLSEKKTHYQELKQGLMQKLLTGKIRVNTNENVTA